MLEDGQAYLCRMEHTEPRTTMTVPAIALVLAAAAAVCFGIGDAVGFQSDTAEHVFMVTFLVGWSLLLGAAAIGGGAAVSLGFRALSGRPVTRFETLVVAATLVLVVIVMATHPLWGSASGTA